MALSSGELSSLGGKLLLMTATATKKTMRVLQEQFPEVSKWSLLLHLPLRNNVTILVPPPQQIPSNFEATLAPFVKRMKENKETYLVIVRGRWICIGIFIRSSRTTNYFFLINIHFFVLFSPSSKVLRKGRFYYLLAGDEGLVARARDAPEDAGEGDSGAQEDLLPIVVCKIKETDSKSIFQRLFRQEETPLSLTKSIIISEISLIFTRTFWLTSSVGVMVIIKI